MIKDELKYKEFNFVINLHHRQKNPQVIIKYTFERKNYIEKIFKYEHNAKDFSDLCRIIDLRYKQKKF